jgi:hypothetical protein
MAWMFQLVIHGVDAFQLVIPAKAGIQWLQSFSMPSSSKVAGFPPSRK